MSFFSKTFVPKVMSSPVRNRLLFAAAVIVVAACVHQTPHETPAAPPEVADASAMDDFAPWARNIASLDKKSGYAVNDETCGEGALKFSRVRIGLRPGYCAGLVVSKEDGLVFPRNIIQVPGSRLFVVTDMGGWGKNLGRLLLLNPEAAEGSRVKVLLEKLDAPHGLGIGLDKKVYVGTIDRIFRLDPLADQPADTIEVILHNLKGRNIKLPDGTTLDKSAHPLKQFVFDRTGRLFINMGAPTDNCLAPAPQGKGCWAGEGAAPLASIWVYTPPAGGIFKTLGAGDANPAYEVYASGLRNSMAMALHSSFPDEGAAFLQGENARDLPDTMKPNEEMNSIEKGAHYGWPYCYDNEAVSPEFASFLQAPGKYQNWCKNTAHYHQPYSLLPPHGAPLSMFYYHADKFPELKGKLIVGLHGYRPTGSRILFYDVNEKGFPKIAEAPVMYNVSCAPEPHRAYQTESAPQVKAAPFNELVAEWHKVNGVRPQGAPVGMTVASDGAIWIVEDKNQSILRLDVDPSQKELEHLACDSRTEGQIKELLGFIAKDKDNRERITQIRSQLVEKHCIECHAGYGIKPDMNPAQKDAAVARFILGQDGWVFPGDPDSGRMHRRVWAIGAEHPMPADGPELIKNDPKYKSLLETLDRFVATMVPGVRKRIMLAQSPALKFRNVRDITCGSIASRTVVVVVDTNPREKPGFQRIYRPADRFLNGQCADSEGYYVASKYLAAAP